MPGSTDGVRLSMSRSTRARKETRGTKSFARNLLNKHTSTWRARGEKLLFAVRRRRANGAAICVYTTTHDHGFLVEEKTEEFRGLFGFHSRDDISELIFPEIASRIFQYFKKL